MIHIEKDQKIPENDNLRVYSNTGDYEDNDLIQFYDISSPSTIAGAFQAQFIKYGSVIYGFNDAEELGEAILKIDPESNQDNASYVRMKKELLKKLDQGNLDKNSLNQVIQEDQKISEQSVSTDTASSTPDVSDNTSDVVNTIQNIDQTSTTTPEILPNLSSDISTTTQSVNNGIIDSSFSSTTPIE